MQNNLNYRIHKLVYPDFLTKVSHYKKNPVYLLLYFQISLNFTHYFLTFEPFWGIIDNFSSFFNLVKLNDYYILFSRCCLALFVSWYTMFRIWNRCWILVPNLGVYTMNHQLLRQTLVFPEKCFFKNSSFWHFDSSFVLKHLF